ncbi:hypothetical protein J0H58_21040 [bacterium]|nr:hypothetical protein [bacterium]
MKWQASHPPLDSEALGQLAPESVLVEYDGLRMFTCRDRSSRLLFAYQCDQEGDLWRYTVAPCSEKQLSRFIAGELTIVQMLSVPWGWVVDIRDGSDIESIWEVDPTALPDDYRPNPEVRLVPTAEPDLSIKWVGDNIDQGHVPLSVIKYASDKAISVVRGLVEYIGSREQYEFTKKQAQDYADLPVSHVTLASFQLSITLPRPVDEDVFGNPANEQDVRVASEMKRLLTKVVKWSSVPGLAKDPTTGPEESIAVLRAIQDLAPSGLTAVQSVELGGRLVTESRAESVGLSPETRKQARESIKDKVKELGPGVKEAIRWPERIQATGVITGGVFNVNAFFLSEVGPVTNLDSDPPEDIEEWPFGDMILFSFDEAVWRPSVVAALDHKARVTVIGKRERQAEMPDGVILANTMPHYNLIDFDRRTAGTSGRSLPPAPSRLLDI